MFLLRLFWLFFSDFGSVLEPQVKVWCYLGVQLINYIIVSENQQLVVLDGSQAT